MDQDIEEIGRVLDTVPLSLLQFHGRESRALCRHFGLPYVKALAMASGSGAEMATDYPDAAALLLDSHEPGAPGGTGKTFDWAIHPDLPRPLVLAGGLTPDNVRPRGAARSGPGQWTFRVAWRVRPASRAVDKMNAFIKEAKREN